MSLEEEDVLVQRLSQIIIHFGFDGWLFNVENPIEKENVPRLVEFVSKVRLATEEVFKL